MGKINIPVKEEHIPWINLATLVFGILLLVGSSVFMDEFITDNNRCVALPSDPKRPCTQLQLLVAGASFGLMGGILQLVGYGIGLVIGKWRLKWFIWSILHASTAVCLIFAILLSMVTEPMSHLQQHHTLCREFGKDAAAGVMVMSCDSFRKREFFLIWCSMDLVFTTLGAVVVFLVVGWMK